MPIDPVCHKQVDSKTPFITALNSRTYYFCSEDCYEEFVENMDDYLEQEEESSTRYAEQ